MKFPKCFTDKFLMIAITCLVGVIVSTTGIIYGQLIESIDENSEIARSNQLEMKNRESVIYETIPELKEISQRDHENIIRICVALEIHCD